MIAKEEDFAKIVTNQQNIVENSWRENYLDRASQTETSTYEKTGANEGSILFPTGVATILFIAFAGIFLKRLKSLKIFNGSLINERHSHNVSCHRCRFFNNNSYLKCAVHPCTVLTSEAKNCSDYWPEHQKDFFFR
jgi:hypothetical protein